MIKRGMFVAVMATSAFLMMAASATVFAASGWVAQDGSWYYYDDNENQVSDQWVKVGENSYWLDGEADGAMATNRLIESGDNYYYVGSDGAMVKNTWVSVENTEQDRAEDPAD